MLASSSRPTPLLMRLRTPPPLFCRIPPKLVVVAWLTVRVLLTPLVGRTMALFVVSTVARLGMDWVAEPISRIPVLDVPKDTALLVKLVVPLSVRVPLLTEVAPV